MAAQKNAPEMFMEDRTARLESNVEHIRSDMSDTKIDIREVRAEIKDVRGEMKQMDQRLTSKIDGVKDSVASLALATEKSFAFLQVSRMVDRLWWGAIAAALLGVMARGFGWI